MNEDRFNKEAFMTHYKKRGYSYESIQTEMDNENNSRVVIKEQETQLSKKVPEFKSKLRHRLVEIPEEIYQASGIRIFGHRIKSLLFSTDVALIRNSNAHAIMSVYPFTPQMAINQSIINASSVPVFVGVGGGTTTGERSIQLAFQSEQAGAVGVVVNSPMENDVIRQIAQIVDVPVVATISSEYDDYVGKLNAGANMLNISGGLDTIRLVTKVRQQVGDVVPIIATGGPTGKSILETIKAGANAITYTPPASADIFAELMAKYRLNK